MHKQQFMQSAIYMRALLNTIETGTLEELKELSARITMQMGEHNIEKMTIPYMRALGASPWNESKGKSLFLIPQFFANNVSPFFSTDINGEKEWFESSTADKDSRYGMLAYGHQWETNIPDVILTSSEQKIQEYKKMDLTAVKPVTELPEVVGTPDEVILYKTIGAAEFIFIEDTIVVIDGKPIVDWKFTYKDHVVPGKPFVWEVRLAYRKNGYIYSCTERANLVFTNETPTSPDFDAYSKPQYSTLNGHPTYKPNTSDMLLVEHKNLGSYADECPRRRALRRHKCELVDLVVPESVIGPWTGELQG